MEKPSTLGARYGHSLAYLFAMGSFTASGVDQLAEAGLHSEIHGSPYLCLPYAGIVRLPCLAFTWVQRIRSQVLVLACRQMFINGTTACSVLTLFNLDTHSFDFITSETETTPSL